QSVRPSRSEAFRVSVPDRLPQFIRREVAHREVAAAVIVPVHRRSIHEAEVVQPNPVSSQMFPVFLLESGLVKSALLPQECFSLLGQSLLLVKPLSEDLHSLLLLELLLTPQLRGYLSSRDPTLIPIELALLFDLRRSVLLFLSSLLPLQFSSLLLLSLTLLLVDLSLGLRLTSLLVELSLT